MLRTVARHLRYHSLCVEGNTAPMGKQEFYYILFDQNIITGSKKNLVGSGLCCILRVCSCSNRDSSKEALALVYNAQICT